MPIKPATNDAYTAIQNAINACPVGKVVYIPAGTYRLNTQLTITKGIVLRGAGPDQTFLKSYANWHAIQMGDWPGSPVATGVSAALPKAPPACRRKHLQPGPGCWRLHRH